jgi:hypothetical protein
MNLPTLHRHAALGNHPPPTWAALRQFADRLQSASRPRFLSSVLVLGGAAFGVVALAQQLQAWLPPWPGP